MTKARELFMVEAQGFSAQEDAQEFIQSNGIPANAIVHYREVISEAHQEPFGYFRATPFGWEDCKKDDEGAIALYEHSRPDHAAALADAARDVLAERKRQTTQEGYSDDHDDLHENDEIAALACFYAMPAGVRDWPAAETGYGETFGSAIVPEGWETKTGDRRSELLKAGALILAEIERLDRASQKGGS